MALPGGHASAERELQEDHHSLITPRLAVRTVQQQQLPQQRREPAQSQLQLHGPADGQREHRMIEA